MSFSSYLHYSIHFSNETWPLIYSKTILTRFSWFATQQHIFAYFYFDRDWGTEQCAMKEELQRTPLGICCSQSPFQSVKESLRHHRRTQLATNHLSSASSSMPITSTYDLAFRSSLFSSFSTLLIQKRENTCDPAVQTWHGSCENSACTIKEVNRTCMCQVKI